MMITDAHIHLDLMENGLELARNAQDVNIRLWNMTTSPKQYLQALEKYGLLSNVHCGLGLHPHFEVKIEGFEKQLAKEWLIGEIGLDFSNRAKVSHAKQRENFSYIIGKCAQYGNKVLSIHSLRAGTNALDIQCRSHIFDSCIIIFHWFSESCDCLQKALKCGAYFSVNNRMLNSKRGKEYARAIPLSRIVLETDFPMQPNSVGNIEQLSSSLTETVAAIAQLHNIEIDAAAETINNNVHKIASIKGYNA